jgi:ABC-type glycerol-3-phosphate transport system substrate-binding protein
MMPAASTTVAQEEPTATPIVAEIGTGGGTHISFWNGLTGSDGVTLNEMLAKFAEDNPDVSVTVEMIIWNTLYQKLQTAFVAGDPPDVILLHASEVPMFGGFGVLKDLGDQYTSGGSCDPVGPISVWTTIKNYWTMTSGG